TPPSSTLFPYTTLFRSRLGVFRGGTETGHNILGSTRIVADGLAVGQGRQLLHPARIKLPSAARHRVVTLDGQEIEEGAELGLPRSEEHTSELQSRGHLV